MTIIAVAMVKDEADVISTTVSQLLAQGVDHILAADNLSTDRTRDILEGFGDQVTVIDDPVIAYEQDAKMTRLARRACEMGAEWVLPFDADELWYGIDQPIADALSACDADVVMAAGWDHIVRSPQDSPFSPWRRPQYQTLSKVAFRATPAAELNMGNHDVRNVGPRRVGGEVLGYRHFQYRSVEQMARKLRNGRAAYEASTVHELHGTHWREGGLLTDDEMSAKWEALRSEDGLAFDPPPIHGRRLSVSVVIPAWNLHDLTAQAVESVLATTSAEVVVVDNGSDPPLTFDDGRVTVVRNAANEGFARACNQGAKAASGDLLAFLNNDTIARPGWLDAMTARWCPGLIVGAHLLYPDGGTQHSGVFFRRRAGLLEAFNRTAPAPSGEVPAVTGACLLISADDFDGWDEGFRNAYEDVDLILRHRQAGGRVWFEASAEVTHLESRTPGRFAHVNHNVALLNERWGHLPI